MYRPPAFATDDASALHGIIRSRAFATVACVEKGAPRFLYHEAGAYRREDGSVVFRGDLDPSLRFAILGPTTLVGPARSLPSAPGCSAAEVSSPPTAPSFSGV